MKNCLLMLFITPLVVAAAYLGSAGAADAHSFSVACPTTSAARDASGTGSLSCEYRPVHGYQPTFDGGPWLNVNLLQTTVADLKSLHDGSSGLTNFPCAPGETPKECPYLPPLDLVHAQICLSDPSVPPAHCPNNYPNNTANLPYHYRLNPQVIPMLQKGLAALREAHLKVVLRFTYNFPCNQPTPPASCYSGKEADAPLSVILQHMRELAPTILTNRDVIQTLQAGFIGRWGEWHNSTNANDLVSHHNAFLDEYTALFKGVTNLEIRRPYMQLDYAFHRFGVRDQAHLLALGLGMHDDEFGSNPSDAGTFMPEQPIFDPTAIQYSECLLRSTGALLSRAFTMTGETSSSYDFAYKPRCTPAVPTPGNFRAFSSAYSLTTLQLSFGKGVWKNWLQQGDYYHILDSIGPHLSLVSAEFAQQARGPIDLTIKIFNSGWAAIARSRPAYLAIIDEAGAVQWQRLAVDLADVKPQQTLTVTSRLELGLTSPSQTYRVYIAAPDPSPRLFGDPGYAMLFGNAGITDTATGRSLLATLSWQH